MSSRYEVIIERSDADAAFVAAVPELPGCMAHGSSREDVLKNAESAIQAWIETAEEFGDPVPQPKGRKLMYA
jgi:predicted RNase H-like HicB family nuclease